MCSAETFCSFAIQWNGYTRFSDVIGFDKKMFTYDDRSPTMIDQTMIQREYVGKKKREKKSNARRSDPNGKAETTM